MDNESHRRQHSKRSFGHRHRHRIDDSDKHSSSNNALKHNQNVSSNGNRLIKQIEITEAPPIILSRDERAAAEFYSVDRRGDIQNLQYETLSRYDVPRYRATGHGRILGLGPKFKVSRETGHVEELQTDPASRNRQERRSLLSSRNLFKEARTYLSLGSDAGENLVELQKDYIPIDRAKRRRVSGASSQHPHDADSMTASDDSSSCLEREGGENAFEIFRDDKIHQRLVDLEEATRLHPENADPWLELAKHQDSIGSPSIGTYERALAAVKLPGGRKELLLGLMKEGRKLWDTRKLFKKWQNILKEERDIDIDLWLRYLDLQQTSLTTFTVDGCLKLYVDVFKRAKSVELVEKREEVCSYLLLRCTSLFKNSGFTERATAIWQAVLEWAFFAPRSDEVNERAELETFESWWESERPRIGEESARGWKNSDPSESLPRRQDLDTVLETTQGRDFESWAVHEELCTRNFRLPARILDETDDPFRMGLFSDVKEFLYRPSTPSGRLLLLDAFFVFCGCPPMSRNARNWWIDPFIRDLRFHSHSENTDQPMLNPTQGCAISNFALDIATLFSNSQSWFSAWSGTSRMETEWVVSDREWRQRAFSQLIGIEDSDLFKEYFIGFQLSLDQSSAKKYAKGILKEHPENLRIYNAFALIECRLNNYTAAERVWVAALGMRNGLDKQNQNDEMALWRSWVWEVLELKQFEKCISILCAIPDGPSDLSRYEYNGSPASEHNAVAIATRLRARRYLESRFTSQLSEHIGESYVAITDLLAILAYLTSQCSLSAAKEIYNRALCSTTLEDESQHLATELLAQSLARLIHFHCVIASPLTYRPAEVSEILLELSQRFPNNTILLSLHDYHTRHTNLIDRLRDAVESVSKISSNSSVSPELSTVSAAFSISKELLRPDFGGRTEHSIRAAFLRSLENELSCTNVSPSLWNEFLRWETSILAVRSKGFNSAVSSKAQKRLRISFSRAVRLCPYHKALYLFAFTSEPLRLALGEDALQDLYDTMVEKGLRIRLERD